MKTTIIINEQHSMLPEQKEILKNRFGTWETLLVPSAGWTKSQRDTICQELRGNIIFVSPIPGMILELALIAQRQASESAQITVWPMVFSNDTREKRELPNGKIIHTVAQTGWYLE